MDRLSFVIPAYNEEESLGELYSLVTENAEKCIEEGLINSFEMLFVDDGSSDGTAAKIKELAAGDERVKFILFRRNFGKSPALQAAFRNVTGDAIITMDADIQDDPAEIKNFIVELEKGYDMVVGWKVNRLDPMEKKLPSKLFNKVTSAMSGLSLHDFDCGYKIFRREVIDALDVYGQMHRYIPVLAYRKGFSIAEMPVHHNKRKFGSSKYGMERYLQGLFDFVSVMFLFKYNDRPMYFFGRIGLAVTALGGLICLYLSVLWAFGSAIGHRPLLQLGVMLVVLGVQFISTGLVGNMIVDNTIRGNYTEAHIKEKKVD